MPCLLITIQAISLINEITLIHLIADLVVLGFPFIIATLLFVDKVNILFLKVFHCDIRSDKGLRISKFFYLYIPLVIRFILDVELIMFLSKMGC